MKQHTGRPLFIVITLFLALIIFTFPTSSAISQRVEEFHPTAALESLPPGLIAWDSGILSRITPDAAIMQVLGNSIIIANGDTTPETGNGTDFGSTEVDGGTVSHTFTIYNGGDVDLNLTGTTEMVSVTGTDAGDFTVTDPPESPIGVGGTTTFTVQFDPSAANLRSATIEIPNDAGGDNTYTFSIQGTGTVPEIDVQGNNVSIGSGDIDPSTTDDTDFGSTAVAGGTVSHTFTIYNTGDADLNMSGYPIVSIGGDNSLDFTIDVQPESPIAPDTSVTFTVQFDPSAGGLRTATVWMVSNDSDENPYYFAIQGTGTVAPEVEVRGNSLVITDGDDVPSLTDWTDFGSTVVVGGTISRTFTINNLGDDVLTLSGTPAVLIDGTHASDFTVTALPSSTVAVGSSTSFTVTFNPSAGDLRSATISIANNDSDENPYNFSIQGTGIVAPEMEVRGNSLIIPDNDITPSLDDWTDFGSTAVEGGTISRTFTINNLGDDVLTLSGTPAILIGGTQSGDFEVTADPASTVLPGSSTSFTVTFNPGAEGLRNGAHPGQRHHTNID